jgi:hypothetical protein
LEPLLWIHALKYAVLVVLELALVIFVIVTQLYFAFVVLNRSRKLMLKERKNCPSGEILSV